MIAMFLMISLITSILVTTPPSAEPVSLEEAKKHLMVDHPEDDTLITGLITSARQQVEDFCQRSVIDQTLTVTLDRFPLPSDGTGNRLYLPRPTLIEIDSIEYLDSNGDTQTLDPDDLIIDASDLETALRPGYGTSWPSVRHCASAVEIVYSSGWANAAAVPAAIKTGMMLLIGHWYKNREEVTAGSTNQLPVAFEALCRPWRCMRYV